MNEPCFWHLLGCLLNTGLTVLFIFFSETRLLAILEIVFKGNSCFVGKNIISLSSAKFSHEMTTFMLKASDGRVDPPKFQQKW